MKIGPYTLQNPLVLAPMAGVTDTAFRQLCRRLGAGYTISEMITSDQRLWDSEKTRTRMVHTDEPEPIAVQIAGTHPKQMADAAQRNVDLGAQIIDINMGCPAKKVCKVNAGSALLSDETLVARILSAVVESVDAPVTLKIRTGVDPKNKNAQQIAHIAEQSGIQALSVHGRTRACRFHGAIDYDTIRDVKKCVRIPIIANGDIDSPEKAKKVLAITGADAIMIGRAAQGRPWIFREIDHYIKYNKKLQRPQTAEICNIMLTHLDDLYSLYGMERGVRVARKHLGWYLKSISNSESFLRTLLKVDDAKQQHHLVKEFFSRRASTGDIAA